MRALVLFVVLLLPPLTPLPLADDACDSEHAAIQQELSQFNTAVAQLNADCGQLSPADYAAKGCAQRADQLNEWRHRLNQKLLDHNTRCGG